MIPDKKSTNQQDMDDFDVETDTTAETSKLNRKRKRSDVPSNK
jgi:hypothetical protein